VKSPVDELFNVPVGPVGAVKALSVSVIVKTVFSPAPATEWISPVKLSRPCVELPGKLLDPPRAVVVPEDVPKSYADPLAARNASMIPSPTASTVYPVAENVATVSTEKVAPPPRVMVIEIVSARAQLVAQKAIERLKARLRRCLLRCSISSDS
jgi:hypothetical protein